MGNPFYVKDNRAQVNAAVMVTSSTEDATYPIANLHDGIQANPFKFTSPSGGWIEYDLGATPPSYDTFALMGHNFEAGAVIEVFSGAAPAPATSRGFMAFRADGVFLHLDSPLSDRYVRIDVAQSGADNVLIGEAWLGTAVFFPVSRRDTPYETGRERIGPDLETVGGVSWVFHETRREIRRYIYRVTEAQLVELKETFDLAIEGNALPFLWVPDSEVNEVFTMRKRANLVARQVQGSALENRVYDVEFLFREESHGLEVLR